MCVCLLKSRCLLPRHSNFSTLPQPKWTAFKHIQLDAGSHSAIKRVMSCADCFLSTPPLYIYNLYSIIYRPSEVQSYNNCPPFPLPPPLRSCTVWYKSPTGGKVPPLPVCTGGRGLSLLTEEISVAVDAGGGKSERGWRCIIDGAAALTQAIDEHVLGWRAWRRQANRLDRRFSSALKGETLCISKGRRGGPAIDWEGGETCQQRRRCDDLLLVLREKSLGHRAGPYSRSSIYI